MPEIQRNLRSLYCRATESDVILGSDWYPKAYSIVLEWSNTYGYSISTVACVIAAISPQCDWERNLIIADDVLADRPISIGGVIHSNLDKAYRIRDDRAGQMLPYFPQGPKVASFARNLAGDYSIATIDTHAMQAGLNDVQANYHLRWTPYKVFTECYREVAVRLKLESAIFQAIIWHAWKRLYPVGIKRHIRRQWHVVGELEGDTWDTAI